MVKSISASQGSFIGVILKKHLNLVLKPNLLITKEIENSNKIYAKSANKLFGEIQHKIYHIENLINYFSINRHNLINVYLDDNDKELIKESYFSYLKRHKEKSKYLQQLAELSGISESFEVSEPLFKSLFEEIIN